MNEFDILKVLEKLDDVDADVDDIEPGFLSELKQQTPDELHSRIMASIRMEAMVNAGIAASESDGDGDNNIKDLPKERETRQRFRFNYKRYATVASAAVILAVVFAGGAKELLNRSVTPDTLSPNESIVMKNNVARTMEDSQAPQTKVTPAEGKDAGQKALKTQEKPDKTNVKSNAAPSSQAALADDKATARTKVAPVTPKAVAPVATTKTNDQDENGVTIVTSQKPEASKEPPVAKVNATPAPEAKTNEVDPNAGTATKSPATIAGNTADPGAESNSEANKTGDAWMTASLENTVNYEFSVDAGMTDILQFVSNKGSKLTEGIYNLKNTDYLLLFQMLEKYSIVPEKVNEPDNDSQSIVIKIKMK